MVGQKSDTEHCLLLIAQPSNNDLLSVGKMRELDMLLEM